MQGGTRVFKEFKPRKTGYSDVVTISRQSQQAVRLVVACAYLYGEWPEGDNYGVIPFSRDIWDSMIKIGMLVVVVVVGRF